MRYGGADYGDVLVGYYDSDQGRLTLSNSTISHSGSYGVYVETNSRFTGFANNLFAENEKAPLILPSNVVGSLDAASTYGDNNGPGGTMNYVEVYAQNTERAMTWRNLGDAHYLITGLVYVEQPLTIEAGVALMFDVDAGRYVHEGGSLNAVGTATDRILFTGSQETKGFWDGLTIRTGSPNNVLDYVDVRYGARITATSSWATTTMIRLVERPQLCGSPGGGGRAGDDVARPAKCALPDTE